MSIITDMKSIMLQVKKEIKGLSGAVKYVWEDDKTIDAAIYLIDDMKTTQSVRYNQSTNTGITFYKDIDKNNNRLRDGETIYDITKVNSRDRFTSLLLRSVEIDG